MRNLVICEANLCLICNSLWGISSNCVDDCVFLFASQFECVWSQMPVNEQRRLQYRDFLKRFGALSRTPHAGLSPEPTVEKPGSTDTEPSTLQRTKVQHMTVSHTKKDQ